MNLDDKIFSDDDTKKLYLLNCPGFKLVGKDAVEIYQHQYHSIIPSNKPKLCPEHSDLLQRLQQEMGGFQ